MIGRVLYFVHIDITLGVNAFTHIRCSRVDENWMMQCVYE